MNPISAKAPTRPRRPLPLPDVLGTVHIPDPLSPGMAGLASYLTRRHARVTISPCRRAFVPSWSSGLSVAGPFSERSPPVRLR